MKVLRLTAITLAGLAAPFAMADVAVTGIVVEGNSPSVGIYNVRVEILKDDKVVGSARTTEDGTFRIALREKPPFSAIARFVKIAYKQNPTRVPFLVAVPASTSHPLAPVRLIPEDATNEYLVQVTESFVASKKKGSALEAAAFYPSILSLSANRKAYVLDQVRMKDPDLFSSISKADGIQADAAKIEIELRKDNPLATVAPDFTAQEDDRFIVTGVRKVKSSGKPVFIDNGTLKRQDLIRGGVIKP